MVTDSGSENVNREVDDLLERVDWRRVLAQVEVTFSNSMIEAFWRSLKHSWIYLHSLDTAAALRRLVEFYVTAHNEMMPHSAFEGQTPDEMYFGTGGEVAINLASARQAAREERMSRPIVRRGAAYVRGRAIQERCSCNGHGPECHETQLGRILRTHKRRATAPDPECNENQRGQMRRRTRGPRRLPTSASARAGPMWNIRMCEGM